MGRTKKKWADVNDIPWQELRDSSVKQERLPSYYNKKLTGNHIKYKELLANKNIIFATGPAGTGKTSLSVLYAIELMKQGKIRKLILTRPLVTCGPSFGFLPGDLNEKVSPYMRSMLDVLDGVLLPDDLDEKLGNGVVELVPLELMRGLSLHDTFIILDEAQNAQYIQLWMLLTRMGVGTKVIICGDTRQTDLPEADGEPLLDVIEKLEKRPTNSEIGFIEFGEQDVLRSDLVKWIDKRLA